MAGTENSDGGEMERTGGREGNQGWIRSGEEKSVVGARMNEPDSDPQSETVRRKKSVTGADSVPGLLLSWSLRFARMNY